MKHAVDPTQTSRAYAFEMWMQAPMPMVTLFKTLDVSHLVRLSRRKKIKFNMLMCWCIGRAANDIAEFHMLPVDGRLMLYDTIAVNTIVANRQGEVSSCDIPFSDDLRRFNDDYMRLTRQVAETCANHDLAESMVIGTSALPRTEIDGAVNIYAGVYNNPFLVWGRVRKKLLRAALPISFQFHHTQMDGAHAARFLDALQREITALKV